MRKGKTVIGQDVYSLSDGTRLETVSDLIINESNDGIIALLVDTGGLMGTSKIIPIGSVHRFGPSAVMVERRDVIIEADDEPDVREILDQEASLLGSSVLTHEGDDLGKISDMYFDEANGRIRGFEVSGGRLGDLMEGTSYLPLDQIKTVGPDAVIASVAAKDHLASQRGGVAGALDSARDKAEDAGGVISEKAGEAGQKLGEAGGQLADDASRAADPDAVLLGRRSRQDVTDRTGSIIVASGQHIDETDLEEARESEELDALYAAAAVERQPSATDQAKDVVDQASATASDLWNRFTTALGDATDATGKKLDAEQTKRRMSRILDSIGRPVTKVFLDREDEVMLDLGDLVTHQAVQRADDNGMLDSLLDSVYHAEVTFDREELRANVSGDSTVDQASGGGVLAELESHVDDLEPSDDPDDEEDDEDVDDDTDEGSDSGAQGTPMTSDAPATGAAATHQGRPAS